MKRHRLAFVGAGRIADVHYASIQAMPARAELVAFCESRPEAVVERQSQWAVPGFESFDRMLREVDPDAICLFLPHDKHLEYVTAAARAGKPVFMEKPVAGTREDARKIVEVVEKSGIQLLDRKSTR